MILEGVYRRFIPLRSGKAPIDARFTHAESLAVAQVEPESYEASRAGRRFGIAWNGAVPTGIAPVQAMPTTAAQWVLFNGDSNKSYLVTNVGVYLFSGTAGVGGTVLGALFSAPDQTGLAQAAGVSISNLANSGLTSKAVVKSGITLSVPATPLWFPVSALPPVAATVGGQSIPPVEPKGKIIIPPKQGLALVVFSAAGTTPLFLPMVEWVELESDLE